MKKILFITTLFCVLVLNAQEKPRLSLEAEAFPLKADWEVATVDGVRCLFTETSTAMPAVVINVDVAGSYNVWARSKDYATVNPKIRKFRIVANDIETEGTGGSHGKEGWEWQNLGKLELVKGENTVMIKRVGVMPRVDCIFFAMDDNFAPNPNHASPAARTHFAANILKSKLEENYSTEFSNLKKLTPIKGGKVVTISNAICKISFAEKTDGKNKFFERHVEVLKPDGTWEAMANCSEENLFWGYTMSDPIYSDVPYFTSWKKAPQAEVEVKMGNCSFKANVPATYPYAPEEMNVLRIKSVEKLSDSSVKLSYVGDVEATMSLPFANASHIKVEVNLPVKNDGYYTVGMTAFSAFERDDFAATQMPPLFQMRNIMQSPKMLGNRFTSHPLALIQKNNFKHEPFVYGVVADPTHLPSQEWTWKGYSYYGFSLASPQNKLQTAIFEPILGANKSFRKSGETIKSSWYIVGMYGRWFDALDSVNNTILAGGKHFREAYETSFSDALANIAKYLKNEEASGWSPKLKGRYNIEDFNLVTNASPLTELSVAILTDDEDYYKNISLPVIEYTLSRQSSHFSPRTKSSPYHGAPYSMTVPSKMWKADYYLSLHRILGNSNEWLEEFAGSADNLNLYSNMPSWVKTFGMYLASPTETLLNKTKAECDPWLEKTFMQSTTEEGDYNNFANVSFYPYWWYLPDLYEVTKDPKYLDYAQRGAFHTMAALWAYPTPEDGDVTINKDNCVRGIGHMWWKGTEQFRLGWNEQEEAKKKLSPELLNTVFSHEVHDAGFIMPEKKANAWKVARLGLGIEQPSTYRCGGSKNDWNILMPSWSAEMLKVYQYTNRDVLQKFSRHAIIGRYANFMGYYVCDFTDLFQDENYSYKGPDISSFYYHHAPCHFAQTLDYMMVQFEIASKGQIKFPFVRQQGYVWFTDRIFLGLGKIYDEENCRIIIDKDAVRPDSTKVSVLTARTENSIIALLLNDSQSPRDVKFSLNADSKLMKDANKSAPIKLYDASGKELSSVKFSDSNQIKIPAQALVYMKIPAAKKQVKIDLPKMQDGGHVSKIGASQTFNDFHAFRIRSPFGKDSIYAVMTGGVEKNATFTLEMQKPYKKTFTCKEFPFEISIYPLPMDSEIVFKVSIQEDGKPLEDLGSYAIKP